MISRSFWIAGCLLSMPMTALANGASLDQTAAAKIDDGNSGWTWSGMNSVSDPGYTGGAAHAGGIGTFGIYTFQGTRIQVYTMSGPAVVVNGRPHKMGKLRVSIDGKIKSTVSLLQTDQSFEVQACDIPGLSDGNHVLQVEPVGGWVVVDEIRVFGKSGNADTHAVEDTTATTSGADHVALFDPLDTLDNIWNKSAHWGLDNLNSGVMGQDRSRGVRKEDDNEFLAYRAKDITKAFVRVYSQVDQSRLMNIVQFYTSSDGGVTTQPVPYVILGSFPGATTGMWIGYDLAIKATPSKTDTLYVVFNAGSGHVWDPQLSQLSIIIK